MDAALIAVAIFLFLIVLFLFSAISNRFTLDRC